MGQKAKIKLIAIGGSAGSLSMVLKMIPYINEGLTIPIILIFHRMQTEETILLDLLSLRTTYKVKEIEDKDVIQAKTIYLAPADYHVLIESDGTISLDASEKINFSRPSIDATFESAGDVCGSSLACILLSGANADGVRGLQSAKKNGATIIVQDPRSAEVSYMPQQAVDTVGVDLLIHDDNLLQLIQLLNAKKE